MLDLVEIERGQVQGVGLLRIAQGASELPAVEKEIGPPSDKNLGLWLVQTPEGAEVADPGLGIAAEINLVEPLEDQQQTPGHM